MAYGRETGFKIGGAGKHGYSLKSDMTFSGKGASGSKGRAKAFGKGGAKMASKMKAHKQARAKV
jgi:hypothetical protein